MSITEHVDLVKVVLESEQKLDSDQVDWTEHPFPDSLEDLIAERHELRTLVAGLEAIRKEIDRRIGDQLGVGGVVRYGDTVLRWTSGGVSRKYRREVWPWIIGAQPDAGESWDHWAEALVARLEAVASTTPKVTGLDAVATYRDMDPKMVRDTFVEETFQPPRLTEMPVDLPQSPAWYKTLTEGQIRTGAIAHE